jgi:hypothetical protein
MIACSICRKFVSKIVIVRRFDEQFNHVGYIVKGDCKTHGRVECDYDDFEELGIDD